LDQILKLAKSSTNCCSTSKITLKEKTFNLTQTRKTDEDQVPDKLNKKADVMDKDTNINL
jgi:hypothetical protein